MPCAYTMADMPATAKPKIVLNMNAAVAIEIKPAASRPISVLIFKRLTP